MESNGSQNNYKEEVDKAVSFVKNNSRYFLAGLVLVIIMLVLFSCTSQSAKEKDPMAGAYQKYEVSKNEELINLIKDYYTAYAAGDAATVETLAYPMSEQEKSYIEFYSQYIESIDSTKLYTKAGLEKGAYIVSAEVGFKYSNIDTVAPGLDFFYVQTDDTGKLYINNLYGSFNQSNGLYDMDTDVSTLIAAFEQQEDVINLQKTVQVSFNEAMESDSALNDFIKTELPDATIAWNTEYQNAKAKAEAEAAAQAEAEAKAAQEAAEAEAKAAEEAELEANSYMGIVTGDDINVRAKADSSSKSIGKLKKGTQIKIYAQIDDFYKIDYNGEKVFVSAKYVRPLEEEEVVEETQQTETEEAAGSFPEGTKITLSDAVKIRKGMGTDYDVVATAYSGETVTVVMSYAEGWTKVKYGKKEGYIKTSLLK